MTLDLIARPPVGFVVEGWSEYHAYPAITCRCAGGAQFHVPRANAKGNERLCNELEEHLDDLVRSNHPFVVVVTIDAREAVRDRRFADCIALKDHLQSRCDNWLREMQGRRALNPLPDRIVVVIQHQTFESWLAADVAGMARATEVVQDVDTSIQWNDVDNELSNPAAWVEQHLRPGIKLKPNGARGIIRHIDVEVAAAKSRSFRKFVNEVTAAYNEWATACGLL